MWASWFLSTLELLQQNRSRFKDQISNTSNLSFARMTCKNPAKPVKVTSFLTFKNMSKRDNAENGLAIYAKTMSPTSLSSDKLTTIIPTQTHTFKKKETPVIKRCNWNFLDDVPFEAFIYGGDFPLSARPFFFGSLHADLAVRTLGVAEPEADPPSHGRVWLFIWSVTPVGSCHSHGHMDTSGHFCQYLLSENCLIWAGKDLGHKPRIEEYVLIYMATSYSFLINWGMIIM